jgi:hypothetical protein
MDILTIGPGMLIPGDDPRETPDRGLANAGPTVGQAAADGDALSAILARESRSSFQTAARLAAAG